MKKSIIKLILAFSSCLILASKTNAQDKNVGVQKEIGSHILTQEGDDKYSYNNKAYRYEKVIEVPGTSKDELYKRAKKWIQANVKSSEQNQFDEEEKSEMHATTALVIEDRIKLNLGQSVSFKLNLYFKEDKYRIEAKDFIYYNTVRTFPLNDLRPIGKKYMVTIYDVFDEVYSAMIKSLEGNMASAKKADW